MKNNTFDSVFYNRIFSYYRFLPIFKQTLDFYKSWLIFSGKILFTILLFPI